MLPDRVSNPGPLTYESGALPIALRSLARSYQESLSNFYYGLPACLNKFCWYIINSGILPPFSVQLLRLSHERLPVDLLYANCSTEL